MNIGILSSGILGFKTVEKISEFFIPGFIATDSKSKELIYFAEKNEIPLFKGPPNNGNLSGFLNKKYFDIIFSINYLFIIEKAVIKKAKYAINFHGSLLPKYRGRTPHVWAIINNEKETGITAHIMDVDCDCGPIIDQLIIPISIDDTGAKMLMKFEQFYPKMLLKLMEDIKTGQIKTTKQDNSKATYFGKRTSDDGQINWNWMKERIFNWIRAQSMPYPGAFTFYKGEKVIIDNIKFSDMGFNYNDSNGKILEIKPNPIIKTTNGAVELISIRGKSFLFKKGEILG